MDIFLRFSKYVTPFKGFCDGSDVSPRDATFKVSSSFDPRMEWHTKLTSQPRSILHRSKSFGYPAYPIFMKYPIPYEYICQMELYPDPKLFYYSILRPRTPSPLPPLNPPLPYQPHTRPRQHLIILRQIHTQSRTRRTRIHTPHHIQNGRIPHSPRSQRRIRIPNALVILWPCRHLCPIRWDSREWQSCRRNVEG
jgi:hypothetical protein